MKIAFIAVGGGVGAVLRYGLAGWAQGLAAASLATFPIGTLAVNLLGCLLIGCGAAAFAEPGIVREEYRLLLLVGLLGGFTTFSTFGLETFELLRERQWAWAAAYVGLSNVGGIAAVIVGYRAVAWITRGGAS